MPRPRFTGHLDGLADHASTWVGVAGCVPVAGGAPGQQIAANAMAGELKKGGYVPAHAQAHASLVGVLRDRAGEMEEIVAAVEADAALAAAALRRASDRHPARGDLSSASRAVEVLGAAGLDALARELPVFDPLEGGEDRAVIDAFRLHARATAHVARYLAEATAWDQPGELTAASLLHDVGKLALPPASPSLTGTPDERLEAERERLGHDHATAGGALARRWGLSVRLAGAIEQHHDPDVDGLAAMLVHYAQGHPVDIHRMAAASSMVSLSRDALASLMYELPSALATTRGSAGRSPLSDREHQVLGRLSEGKVYKQIALELGIAPSTVRAHLHRIYQKLGSVDRAQAVLTATANGWI